MCIYTHTHTHTHIYIYTRYPIIRGKGIPSIITWKGRNVLWILREELNTIAFKKKAIYCVEKCSTYFNAVTAIITFIQIRIICMYIRRGRIENSLIKISRLFLVSSS